MLRLCAQWGIKAFYAFPYVKFPNYSPEIDKVLNENFVDLRNFPLAGGYKGAEDTPTSQTNRGEEPRMVRARVFSCVDGGGRWLAQ